MLSLVLTKSRGIHPAVWTERNIAQMRAQLQKLGLSIRDLEIATCSPTYYRLIQANWIGKSIGGELEFSIVGSDEKIAVFSTRPDTVYDVRDFQFARAYALPITQVIKMPTTRATLFFWKHTRNRA